MSPQLQQMALAATFLALVLLPSGCSAIECYVCNSMKDTGCDDNPAPEMLVNCSESREGSKYTACRKIDTNVDFEVNGLAPVKRVVRQCAVEGEHDRPCYYKAGFGGRVNVCHCFEAKCNGASGLLPSLAASLVALPLTIGLMRRAL